MFFHASFYTLNNFYIQKRSHPASEPRQRVHPSIQPLSPRCNPSEEAEEKRQGVETWGQASHPYDNNCAFVRGKTGSSQLGFRSVPRSWVGTRGLQSANTRPSCFPRRVTCLHRRSLHKLAGSGGTSQFSFDGKQYPGIG